MTQDQTAVIDAYVSEILVGLGAEHIIIVPMTQTVRIALDDGLAGTQPPVDVLLSEGGWSADIGVDLTGLLNEDLSTVEDVPAIGTIYELTIPEPVQTGTYSVTIDGEDLTCDVLTVDAGLSDVTGPCSVAFGDNPAQVLVASGLEGMQADGLFLYSDRPFFAETSDPKMEIERIQDATPAVVFAGTDNAVPFGLGIGFGDNLGGQCTTGTAIPEADWCGSYTPTTRTATCCRCPNGMTGVVASGNVTCQ